MTRNSAKPQEEEDKKSSSSIDIRDDKSNTDVKDKDSDNPNTSTTSTTSTCKIGNNTKKNNNRNRNPSLSSITHIPYRSAGGRSTGSFSVQIPNNSSIYQFIPRAQLQIPPVPVASKSLSNSPVASNAKRSRPRSLSTPSLKHLDYFALSSRSLVTKQRLKLEEEHQQQYQQQQQKQQQQQQLEQQKQQQASLSVQIEFTSAESTREDSSIISEEEDIKIKMDESSSSSQLSHPTAPMVQQESTIKCREENDQDKNNSYNENEDKNENFADDSANPKVAAEICIERNSSDSNKSTIDDVLDKEVTQEEITTSNIVETDEEKTDIISDELKNFVGEQKEKEGVVHNCDKDVQIDDQSENNCNDECNNDGKESDNTEMDTENSGGANAISKLGPIKSKSVEGIDDDDNKEEEGGDHFHVSKVKNDHHDDEEGEDDTVVINRDELNLNVAQKLPLPSDQDYEDDIEKSVNPDKGELSEIKSKDSSQDDDIIINDTDSAPVEQLCDNIEVGDDDNDDNNEISTDEDNSIVDLGTDLSYEEEQKESKKEEEEDLLIEWTDETITHPSTSSNHLSIRNKRGHNDEDVDNVHVIKPEISRNTPLTKSDDNNNIGLTLNSFTNAGLEFGSGNLDTSQIQWTNSNRFVQNDDDSILNEPGMGSVQSSSVVSSITNFSTAASISTFESSTSPVPTSRQLEYLTSHTTLANVPSFTPANTRKRSSTMERKNAKQRSKALLKVWKEVYECNSHLDATHLAIDQANTLQKASVRLVDALFDYLIKFAGVSSQDLFSHEQGIGNNTAGDAMANFDHQCQERKGLVLPACTIGWLASHLYSTYEDECYFAQFENQKKGSFLISPILSHEMKAKLHRLKEFLANKVTRLRVTGSPWPQAVPTGKKRQKMRSRDTGVHIDPEAVNAFLAYYRYLQNRPHIDMRLFPNVTCLELDGVVPEYVTNLHVISKPLKQMTVQRGCIVDVPSFLSCQPLSSLMHLSLSNCAINELAGFSGKRTRRVYRKRKPPLASMEALVSLDVSHNGLIYQETALAGLSILPNLIKINFSHNKIESMSKVHTMLGNIQELNLNGNRIKNVKGIERLYSLEKLGLSHNSISTLADVSGLAKLPELMSLQLKGNPIEKDGLRMSYRLKLLNLFKESRLDKSNKSLTYRDIIALLPIIDDAEVTKKELIALKNLTFSQSVAATSAENAGDNSVQLTGHMSKDPSIRLLEPFRDDYIGPDGCLLSASMLPNQGHRRTTRKSRRRQVRISDTSCTDAERIKLGSKNSKRKRKKGKNTKAQSKKLSDSYPTLVKVIHSMNTEKSHSKASNGIGNQEPDNQEEDVEKDKIKDTIDNDSVELVSCVTNESNSILDEIDAALIDPIILYQNVEYRPEVNTDKASTNVEAGDIDINDDEKSSLTPLEPTSESKTEDNNDPLSEFDIDQPKPAKTAQEKLMETFNFAAAERMSTYDGPDEYASLLVSSYLELYFKSFVFPSTSQKESVNFYEDTTNVIQETQLPRIQLYQTDRDLMMWTLEQHKEKGLSAHIQDNNHEHLVAVSSEKVIPCGIAATGRIPPTETEAKGVRGATIFNEGKPLLMSQCQNLLLCISNAAIYFIPDISGSSGKNRRFPSPIPSDVKFDEAQWPHSYCRHPLKFLKKITFDGFGFQRLTLYFKLPSLRGEVYMQPENGLFSTFDYTYVIFSCNQRRTIELMQKLQRGANDVSNDGLKVENDDNAVLLAVSRALAPKTFSDDILHYHILTQIWQTGDMDGPRRTFILTNERIYLFHETYTGDGSGCAIMSDDGTNMENGNVTMRVVAGTRLAYINDIRVLNEDSRKVSITIKTRNRLSRAVNWILLCKDSENSEKLVQDVRRAMN